MSTGFILGLILVALVAPFVLVYEKRRGREGSEEDLDANLGDVDQTHDLLSRQIQFVCPSATPTEVRQSLLNRVKVQPGGLAAHSLELFQDERLADDAGVWLSFRDASGFDHNFETNVAIFRGPSGNGSEGAIAIAEITTINGRINDVDRMIDWRRKAVEGIRDADPRASFSEERVPLPPRVNRER